MKDFSDKKHQILQTYLSYVTQCRPMEKANLLWSIEFRPLWTDVGSVSMMDGGNLSPLSSRSGAIFSYSILHRVSPFTSPVFALNAPKQRSGQRGLKEDSINLLLSKLKEPINLMPFLPMITMIHQDFLGTYARVMHAHVV